MPGIPEIQLAAFDLDGTLLNAALVIAPENIARLRAISDRGVLLALASGRTRLSIAPYLAQIDRPAAIFACNGARVFLPGATATHVGALAAQRSLPRDLLAELVDTACSLQLMHNLYIGDEILGPLDAARDPLKYYRDLYAERTHCTHRLCDTRALVQTDPPDSAKFLIVTSPERRNQLYSSLHPRFGSRADMVKTNPEYLEFLTPGVHKGWGLQELCTALEIDPARTLAVGDGDNDIELLRAAGRGVCLQNGSTGCRAIADFVTPSTHDQSGIAEALTWAGL